MSYKPYLLAAALLALPQPAEARPVSYPGAWTAIQMNDFESSSLNLHYSPTARYAVGYRGEFFHDNESTMHTLQVNRLLKRWNNPLSQGNTYLKSGIGVAELNDSWGAAAFTGFAADWETRQLFTSYENRLVWKDGINNMFEQRFRLGMSPVLRPYEAWQPWLMVEVAHTPNHEDGNTSVTPLLRLFKDTWLFEAGYNMNSEQMLFNWTKRF